MMTNLDELIAPVPAGAFFERYYERDVLFVTERRPGAVAGLCSRDDLALILGGHKDALHTFTRLGKEERILFPKLAGRSESTYQWVLEQYRAGWTIIVDHLQQLALPVGRLRAGLERDFGCAFDVSAFLTPEDAPGLDPHCDRTDVFILQLEGCKRWRLYGHAGPFLSVDLAALGDPLHDVVLAPGDVLYLPRGYIHQARTEATASLSLSIKPVNPLRPADVLKKLLDAAAEAEPALGRAISPHARGPVTQEAVEASLAVLLRHVRDADAFARTLARLNDDVREATRRYAHPSAVLDDVEVTDAVAVPAAARARVAYDRERDRVSLVFTHGAVENLPGRLEPVLRFIVSSDGPFTAADLPGGFSEATRCTLVRRLLQEGLLRKAAAMHLNGVES